MLIVFNRPIPSEGEKKEKKIILKTCASRKKNAIDQAVYFIFFFMHKLFIFFVSHFFAKLICSFLLLLTAKGVVKPFVRTECASGSRAEGRQVDQLRHIMKNTE